MKHTEQFHALRALIGAADLQLDTSATHEGLANCDLLRKARSALDTLESARDAEPQLRAALQAIAEHEGRDQTTGVFDEWSEAVAFGECRKIASDTLEATGA